MTIVDDKLPFHTKKLEFVTLQRDNYVSWKAQVLGVLGGTDLLRFVEGKVDLNDKYVNLS